jgi:hypothetical protein
MPTIHEAKASLSREESAKNSTQDERGICFVIMPFGTPFDDYFLKIYKPAIEESGLTPMRADDIYHPGDIMRTIWKLTYQAEVILADLTNKNPNVFYEMGLAHALKKPVIIITQSRDDIPFDLRPQRNIEYNKDVHNWGEILKIKITEYIKNTLETPLEETLPAFIDVDDIRKITISKSTANKMIQNLVDRGQRPNTIIQELKKYGVERSYTIEKIYEYKEE